MATWPSSIEITRENYNEKPPVRAIRTAMDVGPAKVRQRSTAAVRNITLSLFLTEAQLETFDAFWLTNEALAFDFTEPRTSSTVRARFTGQEPEYTLDETMWRVVVPLEILP